MDKASLSDYQPKDFNPFQMTKTLIKPRVFPSINIIKIETKLNINKSNLPPNLQTLKQKLLLGNGFNI